MIYNFHIGLPKTATTFWQEKILSNIDGVVLLHNSSREKFIQDLLFELRHYCQKGYKGKHKLTLLAKKFSSLEERFLGSEIMISSENISITSLSFWRDDGAGPEDVIQRLCRLQSALGRPKFRILFGTRDPESWYPSRYA